MRVVFVTRILGLLMCLACRGEARGGQPGAGGAAEAGGAAASGGSDCVGSADYPICSVAECQARANPGGFNGCLDCDGLACAASDTCSGGGHSNGPAVSGCSCVDGKFRCWIRQLPPAGVGGASVVCQQTIIQRGASGSCLDCSGLSCYPTNSCSVPLPDAGRVLSRCACVDGRFSCSLGASGTADAGG